MLKIKKRFFVVTFSQSISPGAVKTEIFTPEVLPQLQGIPFLDPEDVSQSVLYVLGTPPHVQVNCVSIQSTHSDGQFSHLLVAIIVLFQVHELIIKPVGEQA